MSIQCASYESQLKVWFFFPPSSVLTLHRPAERQLISCYVDAVFSAGGIADFTRHGHGPAVVASHCGSFVAIDHLPNIDYRADKWAPTAVAGGWSEELNARVPNGRRFVVLQLAMAEGSRVSGMLVMTVAGLTSGTVSKKFCCGCDPHGDGEKEL